MPRLDLATYAFVRAGLIDGLPLGQLLEARGLDMAGWTAAEREWREEMAGADDPTAVQLSTDLEEHSEKARGAWTRRVDPLDTSLQAWLDFVRALSAAPDALAFMGAHAVDAAVIAHLHRHWARRMRDEPALLAQAGEILEREPGAIGRVTVEPARWVEPRPGRRGSAAGDAANETATAIPVLAAAPATPFAAAADPAVARRAIPAFAVPLPRKPRPPRRVEPLDETAFLKLPVIDEPLPFQGQSETAGAAGAAGAAARGAAAKPQGVAAVVVGKPRHDGEQNLDGTAALPVLDDASALPFVAGAPSQVRASLPGAPPPVADAIGSGTMLIPVLKDEPEDERG